MTHTCTKTHTLPRAIEKSCIYQMAPYLTEIELIEIWTLSWNTIAFVQIYYKNWKLNS